MSSLLEFAAHRARPSVRKKIGPGDFFPEIFEFLRGFT
jgi:hypothetical protein